MYRPCIVTYMDILGFKSLVEKSPPDKVRDILHRFREEANPGKRAPQPMHFVNFSDTNIRATPLDVPEADGGVMWFEVFNLGLIQINLFDDEVLIRGSLTVGNLYFDANLIFGDALIRAYYLESDVAVYPRITVDPQLIQLYKETPRLWLDIHDYNTDKEYVEHHLRKDVDGVYYIDYAGGFADDFDDDGDFARFLLRHKHVIESTAKQMTSLNSISLKYNWLVEYHNSTVRRFGDPIEGVAHRDLLIDPAILPFRHDL
jgi:hypothetical protein